MTSIIEQLKSGKCLCLECKNVAPAGWTVLGRGEQYTTCYYGCEYIDGTHVPVITWEGIQYGEPMHGGWSQQNEDWLKETYPEILEEIEHVEASQVEAMMMRKQSELLEAAE